MVDWSNILTKNTSTAMQNLTNNISSGISGMFEKSLTDLVKGIRANKNNEEQFIRMCIQECKNELKQQDIKKKTNAIQKLTYLHMCGYDMEWAAFHVIEVMSPTIFSIKRSGYLAATQSFTPSTDVIMLTPQLFRKDLKSAEQYECGLALTCLSTICTPDLGRDLVSEVVTLLNSTRPYVRKKSVLCLYKIFIQYPDALRPAFPRLKEKLADNHPSVVSSAVNVICELARKNPVNYLGMAPVFFKLLTTLNNNWTLIKIVKLFGALTPHEPRLAKKLVDPLANLINTTPAKSLLYECLCTVTKGMTKHLTIVKLAVEKLKMFVEDSDQNLKYLGLLGLNNIMPKFPGIIADLKDTILDCLEDEDVTIRYRALDLLTGVVNQKNLKNIVTRLMKHINTAEQAYRDYIVEKIIQTCAKDNYANISNFKWYLETLIKLTDVKSVEHGKLIASQLMNVLIRVKSIREHGVSEMVKLLNSPQLATESAETSAVFEVLYAAAWITGEFITESRVDPRQLLESLLQPQLSSLPDRIQACYVQAIIKIYSHAAARAAGTAGVVQQRQAPTLTSPTSNDIINFEDLTTLTPSSPSVVAEPVHEREEILSNEQQRDMAKIVHQMRQVIRQGFDAFLKSSDVEVQERAAVCLKLIDIHEELVNQGTDIGPQLAALFEEELNPVAKGAQAKVPIPSGLNLDDWIGTPFDQLVDPKVFQEPGSEITKPYSPNDPYSYQGDSYQGESVQTPEGNAGNYYDVRGAFKLVSKNPEPKPLSELGIEVKQKKKVRKVKKRRASINEPPPVISNVEEMPEGYTADVAPTVSRVTDRLSQISLTAPLTDKDVLPTVEAYPLKSEAKAVKKPEERRRKKKPEEAAPKEEEKPRRRKKSSAEAPKDEEKPRRKKRSSSKSDVREKKGEAKGADILEFFDAGSPTQPTTTSESTKKKPVKESATKKLLAKDDKLRVVYSTKCSHPDNMHIHIPVNFENVSGGSLITSLDYNMDSTMNIKLVRPNVAPTATTPVRLPFTLEPGTSNTATFVLNFKSFARPQQLSGKVEYEADGSKQTLPFTLPLPSSMFLVSKKISTQEFGSLIRGNVMPHPGSTSCPTSDKYPDVKAIAKELSKMFHLCVVDSVPDQVYQMYGTSVQNHHLGFQVKVKSAKEVIVELKSSDEQFGTSILGEIHRLFRQ